MAWERQLTNSLPVLLLLLTSLASLLLSSAASSSAPSSASLAACPTTCGPIHLSYPFGTADGCARPEFLLDCNSSSTPPTLSFPDNTQIVTPPFAIHITNLSLDVLVISATMAQHCYDPLNLTGVRPAIQTFNLAGLPYTFSATRNRFTVLGCDAQGLNSFNVTSGFGGCTSTCAGSADVINGSCTGYGCCQTGLPTGMKGFMFSAGSPRNHTGTWSISPCSYAFIIDQEEYAFRSADLTGFLSRETVPVALDWAIGNGTCADAAGSGDYACGGNSHCVNSTNGPGYRCSCDDGFTGNPYLSDGCVDINECEDPLKSPCSDICTNTFGGFNCSCPKGTFGDGLKSGKGCIKENKKFPLLQVILGCGLGLLFLLAIVSWLYWALNRRRLIKLRHKFFEQNGGYLMQQQITSQQGVTDIAKIFTAEELKKATNNYSEAQVLGRGGFGVVYRGVLPDNRVVAIKMSKEVDQSQLEQFINEIIILSRVIHRNVVKILGCCLETQVPLLVYECIPNGTLHFHIHHPERAGKLSWGTRLRIATETAEAIAYLHSFASQPIIHRDIKSANILLDSNFTAKVSDFGASRVVPLDQIHVTTFVQGTLGYLDPECFHTGQLTAQSDVYSFGVVLVELLTGQLPISANRVREETSLTTYFLNAMKQESLFKILEPRVSNEGNPDQLRKVADIARQCLELKGEERPTMKEVAAELGRLRGRENVAENNQETFEVNQEGHDVVSMPTTFTSASNSTSIAVEGGDSDSLPFMSTQGNLMR